MKFSSQRILVAVSAFVALAYGCKHAETERGETEVRTESRSANLKSQDPQVSGDVAKLRKLNRSPAGVDYESESVWSGYVENLRDAAVSAEVIRDNLAVYEKHLHQIEKLLAQPELTDREKGRRLTRLLPEFREFVALQSDRMADVSRRFINSKITLAENHAHSLSKIGAGKTLSSDLARQKNELSARRGLEEVRSLTEKSLFVVRGLRAGKALLGQ